MVYTAVIVAAGSGSRMGLGYNKMLFKLQNQHTILEETVSIFVKDTRCKQIIVVVSEEDKDIFSEVLDDINVTFVFGGATRQESVYHGLQKAECEYVLIHDGARPWLPMEQLNELLTTLESKKACLLMVPAKDTVKIVENGIIKTTLDRSTLWQAQTPQAFLTKAILQAYEKAMLKQAQTSDDAQVMELYGEYKVHVVKGSYENIKVTTIEDIEGK